MAVLNTTSPTVVPRAPTDHPLNTSPSAVTRRACSARRREAYGPEGAGTGRATSSGRIKAASVASTPLTNRPLRSVEYSPAIRTASEMITATGVRLW